jgi:hypothetical protein
MKFTMTSTIFPSIAALVLAVGFAIPAAYASDQQKCSNATLKGSFGYTATGTLINVPAPVAGPFGEVGRQTFDGNGNTEATATLIANDGNVQKVTVVGTYTVNPDCTGSWTTEVSPLGFIVTADFVIDNDGLEIRTIDTGGFAVETRVYTKQFQRDDQQ